MEETIKRDKNGKFTEGNKGGGRKPIPPEIKEALTALVPKAVERLTEIINESDNEKIVMQAVEVIFNRVYGKPAQALDIESNNVNTNRIVLVGEIEEWAK